MTETGAGAPTRWRVRHPETLRHRLRLLRAAGLRAWLLAAVPVLVVAVLGATVVELVAWLVFRVARTSATSWSTPVVPAVGPAVIVAGSRLTDLLDAARADRGGSVEPPPARVPPGGGLRDGEPVRVMRVAGEAHRWRPRCVVLDGPDGWAELVGRGRELRRLTQGDRVVVSGDLRDGGQVRVLTPDGPTLTTVHGADGSLAPPPPRRRRSATRNPSAC